MSKRRKAELNSWSLPSSYRVKMMANSTVYLPIDAKFPKDVYEQYYDAFEAGDTVLIESSRETTGEYNQKNGKRHS